MSRGPAAALVLVVAVGGTACGGDEGDQGAAADDVVVRAVAAGPFEDAPATVAAGEVMLRLVNDDEIAHSLRIEELGAGVGVVPGGEEGAATVELEAGTTYTFYCDVPGHRDLGMEGRFETPA